ncbi:MAG: hypothetical protein E7Y34_00070 [Mycoplasma sp.]|nr:hypothetical protein [Mycoplasma sp.]
MKKYLINLSILLGGAGLIAGGIAAAVLVHSPQADGGSASWDTPLPPRSFENIVNSLEQKTSEEDYKAEYLASADEQIKFFQNELFWKEQQKSRFTIKIELKREEKKQAEEDGNKDKAKELQKEIDDLDKKREDVGSTYTASDSLKYLLKWREAYKKNNTKKTFRQWIESDKNNDKKKWSSVKSDYKILIDDLDHIRDESKKVVEDQEKQVVNKWISTERSTAEWKSKLWKDFNGASNNKEAIDYKVFEKIRDITRKRVQYKIVDTYSVNDLISLDWDAIKKDIFKFKDGKETDESKSDNLENTTLTPEQVYKYLVHKEFWEYKDGKIQLKPYVTLDKHHDVVDIFNNPSNSKSEDQLGKIEDFDLMGVLKFEAIRKRKSKKDKTYEYILSVSKTDKNIDLLTTDKSQFFYKNYQETEKNKRKIYFFGTESKQEEHKILNEDNLKKLWEILRSERLLKVQKYLLGFKPKKDFAGFEAPEDADFNVFYPSNHYYGGKNYIWDDITEGRLFNPDYKLSTREALRNGTTEKDNKRINKNGSMGIKPFYKFWEQDKNKEFALGLLSDIESEETKNKNNTIRLSEKSLGPINKHFKYLHLFNNSHKSRIASMEKNLKSNLPYELQKEFLKNKGDDESKNQYKKKFDLINDFQGQDYKLIIDENGINIVKIKSFNKPKDIKEAIVSDLRIASVENENSFETENDFPDLFKSVFTEYSNFNYLRYLWLLKGTEKEYKRIIKPLQDKHRETIKNKKEMELIENKDNKKLQEISKRKNLFISPKDELNSWDYKTIFSKFWRDK